MRVRGATSQLDHRIDSVIESSLREIIGSKNFALISLSLILCEMTIYDNKVFLENLVEVQLIPNKIIKDFLKFCSCCVLGE